MTAAAGANEPEPIKKGLSRYGSVGMVSGSSMQQVNLGMIGGGTVGGGVYYHLQRNAALMASRLGIRINLVKIAVKAFDEPQRKVPIPRRLLTLDWKEAVLDPKVNVVVEVAGGIEPAREMILTALKRGKPVITANKALLSAHGEELFAAAQRYRANLYYEASVAGGIPIIKVLREAFVGNRLTHLYGIVNGTCNYILTRMKQDGVEFDAALREAQRQGYAEAEPSLDIDGQDSMHKIGILASLAHGFWVSPQRIFVEGIRHITRADIQFADRLGYTIKLLGTIKQVDAGPRRPGSAPRVQVSVCPTLVPNSHVLASVQGVFNAIFVRGDVVGDTLFYGRGAGQDATASAVLSDIADAALDLKYGLANRLPPFVPHAEGGSLVPMDQVVSRYYVRLSVVDRPGVFAKVAGILAANRIGISSIIQPEGHEGETVPVILMIHDAPNAAMRKALACIGRLPVVKAPPVMLRVEDFH